MNRIQKGFLLVLMLVCAGTCTAETYGEALDRIDASLYWLWKFFGWFVFFSIIFALIIFIMVVNHGGDITKLEGQCRRLSDSLNRMEENLKHSNDIINRQEDMIKVLVLKSSSSSSQSVVIQQPKALPSTSKELVEFNPNSAADQTWLASQKRRRQE